MDPELQALLSYILYGQGQQTDNFLGPQVGMSNYDLFGGGINFEKNGDVDYGANATQAGKVRSAFADNVTGALSGTGAYGPNSFQPQNIYEDVKDQDAYLNAQKWMSTGGIEGITAKLARDGMSPTQINGYIVGLADAGVGGKYKKYKADAVARGADPDELDRDFATVQTDKPVGSSFGPPDPSGGNQANYAQLFSTIQGVWDDVTQAAPYFKGMETGEFVEKNGRLQSVTQEPTKAMEWYDDKGLSYPSQQYDYDFFERNSPELQQIAADRPALEAQHAQMRRMMYDTTPVINERGSSDTDYVNQTVPLTDAQRTRIDARGERADPQAGTLYDKALGPANVGPTMDYDSYLASMASDGGAASYLEGSTLTPADLSSSDDAGGSGGLSGRIADLGLLGKVYGASRRPAGMEEGGGARDRVGSRADYFRGMQDRPGRQQDRELAQFAGGYRDPERQKLRGEHGKLRREMQAQQGNQLVTRAVANKLQAEGRTPLQDQLRQRSMQMFLSGSIPGIY